MYQNAQDEKSFKSINYYHQPEDNLKQGGDKSQETKTGHLKT